MSRQRLHCSQCHCEIHQRLWSLLQCQLHPEDYCKRGLRTICLASNANFRKRPLYRHLLQVTSCQHVFDHQHGPGFPYTSNLYPGYCLCRFKSTAREQSHLLQIIRCSALLSNTTSAKSDGSVPVCSGRPTFFSEIFIHGSTTAVYALTRSVSRYFLLACGGKRGWFHLSCTWTACGGRFYAPVSHIACVAWHNHHGTSHLKVEPATDDLIVLGIRGAADPALLIPGFLSCDHHSHTPSSHVVEYLSLGRIDLHTRCLKQYTEPGSDMDGDGRFIETVSL